MRVSIAMIAAALMTSGAGAQDADNTNCPVSGRAVSSSAPTSAHDGHTIGFCCGGCVAKFESWDDQRKDGFVLTFASAPAQEVSAFDGDPYTLGTCPISGRALEDGGVAKTIAEREIRFCCNGCPEAFAESEEKQLAKVNERMINDQAAYYPMTTCLVSGEPLLEDGEFVGVDMVYRNRLVRLCCSDCKDAFKEDAGTYVAKLDKAVAKAQREAYPIATCPISGGKLGSMGDPAEIVIANRLVRFCCAGCIEKLESNPVAFIAELDAAWKEKGMPWAEADTRSKGVTTAGSE